jgi:hypothetical protein
MPARAELEGLSSRELHDRALHHARTHVDVAFLWKLIKAVPVAEAASGHLSEAEADVVSLTSLITDAMTSGDEIELTEALRPLYLEYLADEDSR